MGGERVTRIARTPRRTSQWVRLVTLGLSGLVLVSLVLFFGMFAWTRAGQPPRPVFTNVATSELADARADSHGACWADIDGDDLPDLFVANLKGRSRLWKNTGRGTFVDVAGALETARPIEAAVGCAFVDFDHDGHKDLFLSVADRGTGQSNRIFRNNGNGGFTDVTASANVAMPRHGAAASDWADYDSDGDYDGFIAARTGRERVRHNAFLEGVGAFRFVDRAVQKDLADPPGPPYAFLGSWFDYDGDGDPDLLLAIDFWGAEIFRNDRGTFIRATTSALPLATDNTPGAPPNSPMGATWGDVDNDGCTDVFISGMNFRGQGGFGTEKMGDLVSRFYRSRCDGTFEDATLQAGFIPTGVAEWAANFVDYDNDGDLDLSVVAGHPREILGGSTTPKPAQRKVAALLSVPRKMITPRMAALLQRFEAMVPASGGVGIAAAMPNYLYRNLLVETGRATFVDVTHQTGVADMGPTMGSAWADFDNDGDLDWFVPNRGTPSRLFRNDGPVGNYLRVHLVGSVLRDAVGAQVKIRAGERWQLRHVHVLDGYLSQSQMDPHFGLGRDRVVDEVLVRWPGTSRWGRVCTGVPANRKVTITQAGTCRW